MARLTNKQWVELRTLYEEGGVPVTELAARFGVSRHRIYQKIKNEGWTTEPQDSSNLIVMGTAAKLAMITPAGPGLPEGLAHLTREQIIAKEAEARAAIVMRQRADWDSARPFLEQSLRILREPDYIPPGEKLKTWTDARRRKLAMEVLKIYTTMTNSFTNTQEAERRAYGIDLTVLMPKGDDVSEAEKRAKLIEEIEGIVRASQAKVIDHA